MNRPSRTDEPWETDGMNQSPNHLSGDLTTNQDLNGLVNTRALRRADTIAGGSSAPPADEPHADIADPPDGSSEGARRRSGGRDVKGSVDAVLDDVNRQLGAGDGTAVEVVAVAGGMAPSPGSDGGARGRGSRLTKIKHFLITFGKFVGPGFMISVAYIDPGNYATDIVAGASYRFKLLFVVLLSNIFAILLQSLAIRLGTITGLDLAAACRAFLPRWLNFFLYALAEIAIIATDIAEVIGTAIALNLLIPKLPLVAGCAISIIDVMLILLFYNPSGTMKGLRMFEFGVCLLVLAVVTCFCIQLSLIKDTSVAEVFRGYLPSGALVEQQGLYQACGILGATVMPHSLYLGSGIVQPRLREYDAKKGLLPESLPSSASSDEDAKADKIHYIPSQKAIKHCLKYSITELALSLFTFALFVNSAILIVAGASLYQNPDALDEDIFAIHDLLSRSISPAAGTIFALALLLSGVSAGIVCTIAGQMVSEGALNWHVKPWLRRLVTRSISITPSIIIAGAVGKTGLNAALTGSQVVLSTVLPFVTAPLIYFTCRNRYMTVQPGMARFHVENTTTTNAEDGETVMFNGRYPATNRPGGVKMRNAKWLAVLAVLSWLLITVMNLANLVLLGMGDG